ncbi:MAG: UDP-glucose 4-epimerase GalE [Caldibacillus debilis]|uniref:UDP-glucose 4-epimerase GalE n=1 Tax=Caldibacillus debilis TaxID=301148 RepID=UPI000E382B8C|nr:UDP-glucose 4-epimerase GalE [Caldibacillus debilis]REJ17221.1 MAG: UDP-glucose 4-epimerase GalE [Caldibacillus debilis]
MTNTILVTGGAGYIGSHTIVELYHAGYEAVIVDNFVNSHPHVIDRLEKLIGARPPVYEVDLLNKDQLYEVFQENAFDGVIHFAGLKAVGESNEKPLLYYKNNIMSTINLCELMSEFNVKNLVFSSSATVYSPENQMPVTEESLLGPTNPYGRTKLFIEEILKDLYQSDQEWKITILRYFNPVGAHSSGLIGESPRGIPNNLMPYISNVAVGNLEKLKVFGDDYDTKDGTGVRDYIHVVDLAKGHVKALEKNKAPGVNIYNMGTGRGYSVLEMIQAFEKATGRKIPYEIVGRRKGDVAISYADVQKSNKDLDWKAEKDIHEMCKDAWNWQSNNPNGYE